MRYGIEIVPFGDLADPRKVLELAVAADQCGWEGVCIWDHLLMPYGAGDPWVMLSAIAARTEHVKLVTDIAVIPRYRPEILARLLAGLDLLSQGRVMLGAGLGAIDKEFSLFGRTEDTRTRAEMLDEGLEVITELWTGAPVSFQGKHFMVNGAAMAPSPMQQPRIPVWIGGESKGALRRAARWDGWIMCVINEERQFVKSPEWLSDQVAVISELRGGLDDFEIAVDGLSQPGEQSIMQEFAGAGATWWFESLFLSGASYEDLMARVKAGPPT